MVLVLVQAIFAMAAVDFYGLDDGEDGYYFGSFR